MHLICFLGHYCLMWFQLQHITKWRRPFLLFSTATTKTKLQSKLFQTAYIHCLCYIMNYECFIPRVKEVTHSYIRNSCLFHPNGALMSVTYLLFSHQWHGTVPEVITSLLVISHHLIGKVWGSGWGEQMFLKRGKLLPYSCRKHWGCNWWSFW